MCDLCNERNKQNFLKNNDRVTWGRYTKNNIQPRPWGLRNITLPDSGKIPKGCAPIVVEVSDEAEHQRKQSELPDWFEVEREVISLSAMNR